MLKVIESVEDFSMMYFRWVFYLWLVRDNDFFLMFCVSFWDLYIYRCFYWVLRSRGLVLWLEWEFKEILFLRVVLRVIGIFCSGWMIGFIIGLILRRYGVAFFKVFVYLWINWFFDKWFLDYCYLLRGYV